MSDEPCLVLVASLVVDARVVLSERRHQMRNSIDLAAFVNYALSTFDYDPTYEDDAWVVEFEGIKVYVERKRSHFLCHVGQQRHQLPR